MAGGAGSVVEDEVSIDGSGNCGLVDEIKNENVKRSGKWNKKLTNGTTCEVKCALQ